MNLITLVPPPVEPVTVAEVYEFLRWDPEDEEGVPPTPQYALATTIERNIRTAREFVEAATRRALVKQTLRLDAPVSSAWSCIWRTRHRGLELLRPPVAEVLSVQYFDDNNAIQTLDSDLYYVVDGYVPRLVFEEWLPSMKMREDGLRVTYFAGYPWSDSPAEYTSEIPSSLKDAICLQVQILADRFDVNEKADVERTRDSLLSPFRVHNF